MIWITFEVLCKWELNSIPPSLTELQTMTAEAKADYSTLLYFAIFGRPSVFHTLLFLYSHVAPPPPALCMVLRGP